MFQPQNSDDETILADEAFHVWDPEWSHPSFIKTPTDISSQAITTVSINRDYDRITPITSDATPLSYNSKFTEITSQIITIIFSENPKQQNPQYE